MNTHFDYFYRDASNWKQWPGEDVVLAGTLTEDEKTRLRAACEDGHGEHFVAGQVGLPVLQTQVTPGVDDHGFSELNDITDTDAAPTVEMTAAELLAKFEAVGPKGWDAVAECERLGIPML